MSISTVVRPFLSLLLIAAFISGCAPKKDEESGKSSDDADIKLACGVLLGEDVETEVSSEDGQTVRLVEIFSANTIALEPLLDDLSFGEPFLAKLQGVSDTPQAKSGAAKNRISSLDSGTLTFFPAQGGCFTSGSGGGEAMVGSLLNGSGRSFGEELIKAKLADVVVEDACGGEKIGGCLASIEGAEEETEGELDEFLWKPESDSDGKLAVHTGPSGTIVIVNGETGTNQGGGNGYGSLARFRGTGCSYSGATVQVLDEDSGLPYTVGGATSFTIPNPCGRHCLIDGSIQACSKS